MGIVLKNNIVWGPKKAISEAFFEDVLNIITVGHYHRIKWQKEW